MPISAQRHSAVITQNAESTAGMWMAYFSSMVSPAPKITPCAVCGEPATDWSYDGLDPHEQLDSRTGKLWSADMGHYRPVCAAHSAVLCTPRESGS